MCCVATEWRKGSIWYKDRRWVRLNSPIYNVAQEIVNFDLLPCAIGVCIGFHTYISRNQMFCIRQIYLKERALQHQTSEKKAPNRIN